MASYPCDSMDFVMMDLERPNGRTVMPLVHGDLSAAPRISQCAEGVDGKKTMPG
jgi:hypothetical protein